jgi:hypothetical protein
MSLRETLANPAVGGAIAVVLIAVAVIVILTGGEKPRENIAEVWYYDLDTKQLFAAPATAKPPIAAPSGATVDGQPAGVMANVYGCGDCSKTYISHLTKYTIKGKELLASNTSEGLDKESVTRFIDGDVWAPGGSDELLTIELQITAHLKENCKGAKVVSCQPRDAK